MNLKSWTLHLSPKFLLKYIDRIEQSPIGYRLAKGMFWSVAGSVVLRGVMLLSSILVARMLGKSGFGEFGMVYSTINTIGVFAGFGLGMTSTKYIAEYKVSNPVLAGRVIGLSSIVTLTTGLFVSLLLLFFSPWLATHSLNAPQLTNGLRIGSLILFFSVLNGAQTGVLSGFEAFRTIAKVNTVVSLLSFPLIVLCTYYGGLTGAIWGYSSNLFITWVFNYFALRREAAKFQVPISWKNCGSELPVLWKYAFPAFLSGVMIGPVEWLCNTMLVKQPDGYGELGVYNVANQWFTLALFLPLQLNTVILPILSEKLSQNQQQQSRKTLLIAMLTNALLIFPVVIIGGLASPLIMRLYGPNFVDGWSTLVVLLITAGIAAVLAPVGQVISASGKMWYGFLFNSLWAGVLLAMTYSLVHYGAIGVATARGIAYACHSVWVFAYAYILVKDKRQPS